MERAADYSAASVRDVRVCAALGWCIRSIRVFHIPIARCGGWGLPLTRTCE